MRSLLMASVLALTTCGAAAAQATPPTEPQGTNTGLREAAAGGQIPAPPATPNGLANRELLAWWYLEVDRAWEQARPGADAAKARAAHEAFDRATLAFFRFDMADAIGQLARLRRSLTGGRVESPVRALSLQVEPRVWVVGKAAPAATLATLDRGGDLPGSLSLEVADAAGTKATFAVTATRAAGDTGPWTLGGIDWASVQAMRGERPVATLRMTLLHEGEALAADRLVVSTGSLSEMRRRHAEALALIDAKDDALRSAAAMFESRNATLTDEPGRNKSSEFLAPYDTLTESLAAELAALQAGRSPYPRDGAWWTTVQAGKTAIPCWFDAPPAADRRGPMPLLIVLHGAGGDESMFLHGYGQGGLVKAAVSKGWVVVSPGTTAMMSSPASTKAVVNAASAMYAIDPARIYVAGHSMGGAATSMIARQLKGMIAAAVCFAGGSFDPTQPCAPTLVLGAEVDPLIPASRLAANVRKAAAAGLPVEFEECKGNGHTLIVGDHVARALAYLEPKRLAPAEQQAR